MTERLPYDRHASRVTAMSEKPAKAAPAEPGIPAGGLERQLNADVARLADSVQQLAQGHLDAAVPTPETPQLAPLARALDQMRDDLAAARAALRRSTAEEARRDWGLEMARDIQQSFLPREFPEI